MVNEKFRYKNWQEVEERANELGIRFPYTENVSVLNTPLPLHSKMLHNRFVIQPIEGCDALSDGSPSEMTIRRYKRFASSGSGLIWMEATAAHPDYRSSNGQLYITEENVDAFARMVETIRNYYEKEHGYEPVLVLQITHSGRYRKVNNIPMPVIAQHNFYMEKTTPLSNEHIVTDDELKQIEEQFGKAAVWVKRAGFDGMDIKCAHYYLGSELLSAYDRQGAYGGSFENRTRFLMNCMRAAKPETDDKFFLTCRLNGYDGFPYPYGFGVTKGGGLEPDYSETSKIIDQLHEEIGVNLINITLGNPYFNPFVNRPYDIGPVEPAEHPFIGVSRMLEGAKIIKQMNPDVTIVASGLSYMREFAGNIAAGAVAAGDFELAGFGRLALACPEFARKITDGTLTRKECCVTCTNCSNLMRKFRPAGCVIHDSIQYKPV